MPGSKGRVFTRAFKLSAVRRMHAGEDVGALARELGVRRKLLYDWREHFRNEGPEGLRPRGRPSNDGVAGVGAADELAVAQARIVELERKIGQQQVDLDFFRAALRQVGGGRRRSGGPGEPGSTP